MTWWTLSVLTGLTTALGVMLALCFGQPSKKALAFYLGLSAGIMSVIIFFDLLPAAFRQGPIEAVGIGLGVGLLIMIMIYEALHRKRHAQPFRKGLDLRQGEYLPMGVALALAVAVHHIPEGIAIGAGMEAGRGLGMLIAASIALHNIPEGIGLAIPFMLSGMRKRSIILISLAISLSIPFGAFLGKSFFVDSTFMVSMGMAFAAGAMGFIVWKELIPVSLKHHRLRAWMGMALSVVFMIMIHFLR